MNTTAVKQNNITKNDPVAQEEFLNTRQSTASSKMYRSVTICPLNVISEHKFNFSVDYFKIFKDGDPRKGPVY